MAPHIWHPSRPHPSRTGVCRRALVCPRCRCPAAWLTALDVVAEMPDSALPPMHIPNDGPPQSRMWPAKNPRAAARLAAVRAALLTIAERYELPMENLITP